MVNILRRNDKKPEPGAETRTRNKARAAWNDGLFYELQLNGPAPDRIRLTIADPRKANPDRVQRLREVFRQSRPDNQGAQAPSALMAEQDLIGPNSLIQSNLSASLADQWRLAKEGTSQYRYMQTFAWLRDLAACGDEGKAVAQALIETWLDLYSRYSPEIWATDLVAERLWQCIHYGVWVLEGQEALWRSRLLTALARQTRHLSKSVSRIESPTDRLFSALSLCVMGLGLPHHDICEEQGSTLLRRELRLQLRGDGGHVSRNPSCQLALALRLQGLLQAYRAQNQEPPGFLFHAVSRTTDMVEFFRCGDGRLAVFNGGLEDDPKALAAALSFDNAGRARVDFATQSGYQRLSSARSFAYLDMGAPQTLPTHARSENHAAASLYEGAFALQFSSGRQRLIVNCGSATALMARPEGLDAAALQAWRQALCGADAHSTLCLETPADSHAMSDVSRRPAYHRLEEDTRGQHLELERYNVPGAPGATHRRRIYLGIDGDDLRGEDVLISGEDEAMPDWLLRFHLHPTLKASLSRDECSVILSTPANEGWKFKVAGAHIELVKSIYCGVSGPVQPCEQIIVRPVKSQGAARQVKWSFRKNGA